MGRFSCVVVIPAYNEEASLASVVESLVVFADVLVVDDGSIDRTASEARSAGASVLQLQWNGGYDNALKSGLLAAYDAGYAQLITCDADGQHSPSDVLQAIQHLREGRELALGNRNSFPRWAERLFASHSQNRHGIADPMCGLKAYSRDAVASVDFGQMVGSIGSGVAISLSRSGAEVWNFDINVRDRIATKSRFGLGFSANIKIIAALLRCMISDSRFAPKRLARR